MMLFEANFAEHEKLFSIEDYFSLKGNMRRVNLKKKKKKK